MLTDKTKILLVEDNELTSRIMQKQLSNLGYIVCDSVRTGEDAIQSVSKNIPDIILMDIGLKEGRLDGIKTTSIIRGRYNIPVIYVTGNSDTDTIERAKTTEPYGYIHKPVNEKDLRTGIEIAIYKHRTEMEMQRSREELRALSARLETIREEERKNISREIHDELGQNLACMKIDAIWLEKRITDEPLRKKTVSMIDLITSTIGTVRRIASNLRPGVLDKLGLFSAIEWQTQEFVKRTGIVCELDLPSELPEISPERSIGIFRIFQESLTNIAKHANATLANVTIECNASKLTLEVRDNGKGIKGNEMEKPESFGIIGMKERALLLGGTITIESGIENGTKIQIEIPLNKSNLKNEFESNTYRRPQLSAQRA